MNSFIKGHTLDRDDLHPLGQAKELRALPDGDLFLRSALFGPPDPAAPEVSQ